MPRISRWNNVPGELCTEVDLVLPFFSSGYSDPGQCSGPPERCYPPECDDERTFSECAYLDVMGKHVKLTEAQTNLLLDLLDEQVHAVRLDK